MTLSISAILKPTAKQMLGGLSGVIAKAEAHAASAGFDEAALMQCRFTPDMLPFPTQVRIASDLFARGAARIAALEAPTFPDEETTLAELRERTAKALAYLDGVSDAALDSGGAREVRFPLGPERTGRMLGEPYLLHFLLPNTYFHVTTAYALLRHNGVPLGKLDFLGEIPGFTVTDTPFA